MAVLGAKKGKKMRDIDPNELILTFGGCYLCATFSENRSRNATVRVRADRHMHRQRQTEFIMCPMLGHIKKN